MKKGSVRNYNGNVHLVYVHRIHRKSISPVCVETKNDFALKLPYFFVSCPLLD